MRPRVCCLPALALLVATGAGAAAQTPTGRASGTPAAASLLRVPFPGDQGNLNPYSFGAGYPLLTLIYDTLLWRDASGSPRPWLAQSVQLSPDGLTATLPLTAGVRWQDGVPLTAEDVAFSFSHFATHPQPRFTPELEAVSGVEAPDAGTVVIHLAHPLGGLTDEPLADLPIIPKHLWSSLPAGQQAPDGLPVGSGPYRLVAHRPGEGYRFEASPGYFRGPPSVSTIEIPLIPSAEAAREALRRVAVDMIPVSPSLRPGNRPRGIGVRLSRGPSYAGIDLILNTRRPPFDRTTVRQAVAQALDLPRLVQAVGDGVPAERGYLHPQSPWAPPQRLQHSDPEASRQVLQGLLEAPLPVLAIQDDAVEMECANQVVLALRRVGLEASIEAVSRDDMARALGAGESAPDFQLAIAAHGAGVSYDPDELTRLFSTDPARAGLNRSGYRSSEFDTLAQRAAAAVDPTARREAVAAALRQLANDAPVVPLIFPSGVYAYRSFAYDSWVFVRGSGILDKLSFLQPRLPQRVGTVNPAGGGSGPPVAGWIAIALVAAALGILANALLRSR